MTDKSLEVCVQCGTEIEGSGVRHHGNVFCSEDCCDEYDQAGDDLDAPDMDKLDEDEDDDLDDDLGYREDGDLYGEDDLLDDDFAIDPDDF